MKKGLLVINLGTPSAATPKAVRHYLREFLSDPRVLDIPRWARLGLLHGVILPFRPYKTAKAYQSIWDKSTGSPLLHLSSKLIDALQAELGQTYIVRLAMRYGHPKLDDVIADMLPNIDQLTILPLYPQYASSTTGSVMAKCFEILSESWNIPSIDIRQDFYDHDWYINAYVARAKPYLQMFKPDHVLLSFHGLPLRQVQKSEKTICEGIACPSIKDENRFCYRAQCYATARKLVDELGLSQKTTVAFQSRLGRIPWIKPYTDKVLPDLYQSGVRRLSVICPSFVTDCLETLEEIGIRLRDVWHELGGEAFQLVPCLNDSPGFVQGLANWVRSDAVPQGKMMLSQVTCPSGGVV